MGPYQDWQESTPCTNPNAQIQRPRWVAHRRVIRVTNASYRNATLSGTFELEDQGTGNPVQVTPLGKSKVRVICAWHDVTPPTVYPGLDLSNAEYELVADYTGDVADNIS